MKLSLVLPIFLCGCSGFGAKQLDKSWQADFENGKLSSITYREIASKAKANTFFEAKSKLSGFKSLQTDKTQSTSIGSLTQEATSTNLTALAQAAVNVLEEINKLKSPVIIP